MTAPRERKAKVPTTPAAMAVFRLPSAVGISYGTREGGTTELSGSADAVSRTVALVAVEVEVSELEVVIVAMVEMVVVQSLSSSSPSSLAN